VKLFERLTREYADADPDIKRLIVHQLEGDALDFEADECFSFLHGVATRERGPLAVQARRTLRRLLPQYFALRYQLRQPTSTAKAGTWTEYNIDRSEIDKLKRLGLAKAQDFSQIQMEQFLRSGLHLLSAPIGRLVDRLHRLPDSARGSAIVCLGHLGTPEAVEALTVTAAQSPALARLVAGALAEAKSDLAFQALSGMLAGARDPELAGDIAAELKFFPTPAARDLLVKALDGELPVRIGATSALGSFGKLSAVPALVRMAHSGEPAVVRWALDGLARIGDPAALPELEKCYAVQDDAWAKRLAVQAAGNTRDRRAHDFVKRALGSADAQVRAVALEGLIRVHLPEQEMFDLSLKLVNDPHPEVAANAILAAAPIDSAMATHKVRALLSDKEYLARRCGVWCLGYVHSQHSLHWLKQAIYYDADERVVVGAVKALAKYDAAESADLLVGVLKHQNRLVRLNAARVLADCKNRDAARKIFPKVSQCLAGETDARVRAALVRALSRLGDPSQSLLVGKGLKDSAEEVVLASIEGLDVLGNIDSIAMLEPFVADTRPQVKAQAVLALWHQGEVRIAKKLAEGLDSTDDAHVVGSVQALAEILASVRRLEDSSKYVLLFSELKANLKSPEFVAYEARVKDVKMDLALSQSRVDTFEFQTVIDTLTKGEPVGADPPSVPRGPPAPAATQAPPAPVSTPAPGSTSASTPALPGAVDTDLLATSGPTNRLGFLATASTPVPEEAPAPEAPGPEVEMEELLQKVIRGSGRAALARLAQIARETGSATAHLLSAQVLAQMSGGDSPDRSGSMEARVADELEKAARAAPGHVEPLLRLVEHHRDRDRAQMYRHALAAIRTGLAALSGQADLAGEILDKGAPDDVTPLVGQLMRQLPMLAQANTLHGEALYRRNQFALAFEQLQMSHAVEPANHALTFLLARTASRTGRETYARTLLDGLLATTGVEPELADKARALLKKL
jgi:HEAT repeat protein